MYQHSNEPVNFSQFSLSSWKPYRWNAVRTLQGPAGTLQTACTTDSTQTVVLSTHHPACFASSPVCLETADSTKGIRPKLTGWWYYGIIPRFSTKLPPSHCQAFKQQTQSMSAVFSSLSLSPQQPTMDPYPSGTSQQTCFQHKLGKSAPGQVLAATIGSPTTATRAEAWATVLCGCRYPGSHWV